MPNPTESRAEAADVLRGWALNESLKQTVLADSALASAASRIARRYIAGESATDALDYLQNNAHRTHLFSVECVGESVRDSETAARETRVFLDLIERLKAGGLSPTISFDLSHVGSLVDQHLGLEHSRRIAEAAAEAGTYVMISAEGSDRTDLVLDIFEKLSDTYPSTGITLQARLHRTQEDLDRVMHRPGPIRMVKGAFLEPESIAIPRKSTKLVEAYLGFTDQLISAGHRVNLATHDTDLISHLRDHLGEALRSSHVEFEMLQGLGTELLDTLRGEGYATREYSVFGPEWWLYVLNRIAEQPERVFAAIRDLA